MAFKGTFVLDYFELDDDGRFVQQSGYLIHFVWAVTF